MAKKSAIEKDKRRRRIVANQSVKRSALKKIVMDKEVTIEERFKAMIKLASLPRDGSKVRVRNRCEISGRPRAYYRKFRMSRIALRELGSAGKITGLIKSSW